MLQRKTGLKRTAGPKRRKGLCAQSRGLRRVKAEQRKVYAELDADRERSCLACGTPHNLDHSHCFPQRRYPEHRNNSLNLVDLCREHHELFEHNKPAFARQYPAAYAETLRRMELVDPSALRFFLLKNPPASFLLNHGQRND